MKRDSWVPSKYQFLCSDHFTPDSLDIRWGIRYLKQTAIPTIFSVPGDSQGKDPHPKMPQKTKLENKNDVWLKPKSKESFASNEPENTLINTDALPRCAELLDSSGVVQLPALKTESSHKLTFNLVEKDIDEPESIVETSFNQGIGVSGFYTSFENINSTTITLTTSDSENIQHSLEQEVFEITTNHITNTNFTNDSMEIKSAQENPVLLNTITQTIKELNGNKESVIAIFVPTENSRRTINSFIPAQQETVEMEDIGSEVSLYKDVDYGMEVSQTEHSYCKQDINKEHLWQKISKLHSKIMLLELQEQQTLGRLRSLEALTRQLKQENWLSEENVKIIENHFTTYEFTML
ncbi:LOW QUALITY PROTEIN: THAP domain-containing protein 5 [Rhynchocyon petersi]